MFNSSFEEFVDTDMSGNVAQLGKYQILFHSKKEEDAVNQTQLAELPMRRVQNAESPEDAPGPSGESWEHFFGPVSHSGLIDMKLRNLRRTLQEDQCHYSRRGRASAPSTLTVTVDMAIGEESIAEWITTIKRLRPNPENAPAIKRGMEETYAHRRLWINGQSPTLEEIFQQYPRFTDLPYLFDSEFQKMFPGKEDLFLRKWEGQIVPQLLKVAAIETPGLVPDGEESDESRSFRALQILTHLLPPTASGKKGSTRISVKSALPYMLDIKPSGTSIPSLLESSGAEVGATQPKLVCLGHPSTRANTSLWPRMTKSPSHFRMKVWSVPWTSCSIGGQLVLQKFNMFHVCVLMFQIRSIDPHGK